MQRGQPRPFASNVTFVKLMDASRTMRNHCMAATRGDTTRWKLSFHRSFPNHWHRCSTSRPRCLRLLFISAPVFLDERIPRFLLSSLISTAFSRCLVLPSRATFIYLGDIATRKFLLIDARVAFYHFPRVVSHSSDFESFLRFQMSLIASAHTFYPRFDISISENCDVSSFGDRSTENHRFADHLPRGCFYYFLLFVFPNLITVKWAPALRTPWQVWLPVLFGSSYTRRITIPMKGTPFSILIPYLSSSSSPNLCRDKTVRISKLQQGGYLWLKILELISTRQSKNDDISILCRGSISIRFQEIEGYLIVWENSEIETRLQLPVRWR